MLFCLEDGTPLETDASSDPTLVIPRGSVQTLVREEPVRRGGGTNILLFGVILLLSVAAVGFGVAYFLTASQKENSIAVANNSNANQTEPKREQRSGLSGVAAEPEKTPEKPPATQTQIAATGPLPPSTAARTVDPPTNVRLTPNGKIQCVLKEKGAITILRVPSIPDNNGFWYRTTACGGSGLIHSSQITFD